MNSGDSITNSGMSGMGTENGNLMPRHGENSGKNSMKILKRKEIKNLKSDLNELDRRWKIMKIFVPIEGALQINREMNMYIGIIIHGLAVVGGRNTIGNIILIVTMVTGVNLTRNIRSNIDKTWRWLNLCFGGWKKWFSCLLLHLYL